ncbi:MAG: Ig-like domain-containing protein [Bacteroidaceae bacterium]|nr:Ig-like domain-containing protein [Bacteroidaceae bacterium]
MVSLEEIWRRSALFLFQDVGAVLSNKKGNIAKQHLIQKVMRNKLFILMLAAASMLCVTSCSHTDKDVIPNIPSEYYLRVGQTRSLEYRANWESDNPFVATIDQMGNITANKIGTARVSAKNLPTCLVKVSGYSLYDEPIIEWGISYSQLVSRLGKPDTDDGKNIGYLTGKDAAPVVQYTLKNGGLEAVSLAVKSSYSESLAKHLTQRYQPVTIKDNYYFFIDAEKPSLAKTMIGATLYNLEYFGVVYMRYNQTKNNINDEDVLDMIKNSLSKIEMEQ